MGQGIEVARKTVDDQTRKIFAAPAGSVVVLDPDDGAVLAMASFPTFDPNEFIGGISEQSFQRLQDPSGAFPLNNRVIQGEYAPGSTFKLATSLAAMKDGLVGAQDIFNDTGSYTITGERPATITNAKGLANGRVNISQAITVSSDVFFYSLGQRFWDSRGKLGKTPIQDAARSVGMGDHTGVDLPFEADGRVPDPASRAALNRSNPEAFPTADWFTGDNVNLAVGQGEMVLTPLQLANAYATFANSGTVYAPHVGGAVLDQATTVRSIQARALGKVDLPPAVREPLLAGFRGVVADPRGTAFAAFGGFPLPRFSVAGKTGTAEGSGGRVRRVTRALGRRRGACC